MRRLLVLTLPAALMMGTGCVAHYHQPGGTYSSHTTYEYRYSGSHPDPYGGWCPARRSQDRPA